MRNDTSKKKKTWIIGSLMAAIFLTIGGILVYHQSNTQKSIKDKSPSLISLNQLSEQKLEKCLLEDFSRRLELKDYFVFSSKELTDQNWETEIEGKKYLFPDSWVMKSNLAADFSQLIGQRKDFIGFFPLLFITSVGTNGAIGKEVDSPEFFFIFDKKSHQSRWL